MHLDRRSSSVSSMTGSITSISSSTMSEGAQPRRRPTAAQLHLLQRTFKSKAHPTREERVVLATEIGMDFKTLTTWFQNKRSTARRQALSWKNTAPRSHLHKPSLASLRTSSKTHVLRKTVSLDLIAKLSERPTSENTAPSLPRPPLTPRRSVHSQISSNNVELWERMLSSPNVGPPSPSVDRARLAVFPYKSQTWKSLEWACTKARTSETHGRYTDQPLPKLKLEPENQNDEDTDTEAEEAVTPNTSAEWFPPLISVGPETPDEGKEGVVRPKSEDMEAAMVLLDFMKQS